MNKRIKKKKESFSYKNREDMTGFITFKAFATYGGRCSKAGIIPKNYIRWRIFLEPLSINKRHTIFREMQRTEV
jgi:hypothetical protein